MEMNISFFCFLVVIHFINIFQIKNQLNYRQFKCAIFITPEKTCQFQDSENEAVFLQNLLKIFSLDWDQFL